MKKVFALGIVLGLMFAVSTSFADEVLSPHKVFVEHNGTWTSTTLFSYDYDCGAGRNCEVWAQYGLNCTNVDGVSWYTRTSASEPVESYHSWYWDSDDTSWHNTWDTVRAFNSGGTRYYNSKETNGLNNDDFDPRGITIIYKAHSDYLNSYLDINGYL